jgi:hypothetical protein
MTDAETWEQAKIAIEELEQLTPRFATALAAEDLTEDQARSVVEEYERTTEPARAALTASLGVEQAHAVWRAVMRRLLPRHGEGVA